MENKMVPFDPVDGSDMLEKMKNFANVSSDMTKSIIAQTEQGIKAIIAQTEQGMMENKMLKAQLAELQKHKEAIQNYQQNFELFETRSNVSSLGDMVMNYPLSPEYIKKLKVAINCKVDELLAQFPQWYKIRSVFIQHLIRQNNNRFKTRRIDRAPAILYNEMLEYVEHYDFLKGRTILSLALLDFRAENKLTQKDMAELIGISIATYSKWESGGIPANGYINAIANLLNKTPEEIVLMGESRLSKNNRPKAARKDIAKLLKNARKKMCYTLRKAANVIGASSATYSQWETGKFFPSSKYIAKILKFIEDAENCPAVSRTYEQLTDTNTLPRKLLSVRVKRGINQSTAAREIGVHHSAYYRWENGESKPSQRFIPKVQEFLKSGLDTASQ